MRDFHPDCQIGSGPAAAEANELCTLLNEIYEVLAGLSDCVCVQAVCACTTTSLLFGAPAMCHILHPARISCRCPEMHPTSCMRILNES